ncbi:hypothetical protein FHQ26_05500 [Testudinibacter sp. TR-2022]|uniref:hypothetical protein n=1 Tax=Testudinibacter sp. TR-2022 TaxID=2585029 RepID=UPI00111A9ECC|nr:hypothetical protein [Testudinibacter sp. TR-2022]TNH04952.1 hypothetical protein FHQ22_02655 [Pasteurellaceae bacterium Phil31]TNH06733.1 hypothetical protein FHQ25_12075 [Testudinibacter sp. TR-2022]TNH10230.1 hypothetical protein FHQ26_05500 [Testudinibacter sp. TR-2022]
MANSQTERSRALRAASAKKSIKEARESGRVASYLVSGDRELIESQKQHLKNIPGQSYAAKISYLIDNQKNKGKHVTDCQ